MSQATRFEEISAGHVPQDDRAFLTLTLNPAPTPTLALPLPLALTLAASPSPSPNPNPNVPQDDRPETTNRILAEWLATCI